VRQHTVSSVAQDMKLCTRCRVLKSVREFGRDARHSDGLQSWCRPCIAEWTRLRYAERQEEKLAKLRADRAANPEKWRNYGRTAYHRNPEYHRERQRRYRLSDLNKAKARQLASRRRHPEAHCRREHIRRARKMMNGGAYSLRDVQRLLRRYGGKCAYCGKSKAMTMDHVIPISRGGTSFIGNLLPACKPCNSSKGDRVLVEWKSRLLWQRRKAA
jgi:5-methylcytosine-specific restriction endonuclease McrA